MPARDARSKTFVVSLENRKARGAGHERRDEILKAARALFLEHGVEAVSTRQIAAKVGISQTGLYNYFDSKDDMLDALVEIAFAKLVAQVNAAVADSKDPIGTFRATATAYIRFGMAYPDEYRLAFMLRDGRRAETAEDPPCSDKQSPRDKAFSALQARMAAGIDAGTFRDAFGSPEIVARCVWASLHGLVAILLAYPDFGQGVADTMIEAHLSILLNGLHKTGSMV